MPDFHEIAERHAVEALGAREADGHAANRAGFDVWHEDRKVEVKSKTPTHGQSSYVIVRERQHEADEYWFYLFGKAVNELRVFAVPTADVLANLHTRAGTAISVRRIETMGRRLWPLGSEG